MRIVVAPDSYKGSVSALGVAEAMERGIHAVFPQAEVLKVPIADGGEGTVEALVAATGGRLETAWCPAPWGSRSGPLGRAGRRRDGGHRDGRGLGPAPGPQGAAGIPASPPPWAPAAC